MVLVLDEESVSKLVDVTSIISSVENTLKEYSEKRAIMPARYQLDRPESTGTIRVMLAASPASQAAGLKVLTGTAGKRAPDRTYFVIMLFDQDGSLLSILSANRLTQLRTGAASAVATRYLARRDSTTLGLIGAGVQGFGQVEAISHVMRIERGLVYDVSMQQTKKIQKIAADRLGLSLELAQSANEVAESSDVLVTATTSDHPLFNGSIVRPGTHINAVGSNMPSRVELDTDVLRKSRVYVDSLEQATKESGDFINAIAKGAYKPADIVGEIGEVIAGKKPGRTDSRDITVFKSVGIAVEDLAAAQTIYRLALREKVGVEIKL